MSRVTITNPYDLLLDENEDRSNVPQKKEQKPAAPAKPAAKPAATGVAAKPAASKPAAAKPAAAQPAAGAKAPAKAADNKAPAKAASNSAPGSVKPAPPRDSNQNLQERDKESRAPRDKRDYRQPVPAGGDRKRTFDRKSGTGRPQNEIKKGGQGKGNWGGEVDAKEGVEALKEKEEKTDEKEEGAENAEEKVTVEGEKKEGEIAKDDQQPAKEEEAKTFTLDEYLANRKLKAPQVEALKPRTVNADDFGAAGFVALQRGEQGEAPLNAKEKKEKKPAAEKTEKPAGEKKEKTENLAAKLLTFASHEDSQRRDRPFRRNNSYDRPQGDRSQGPRRGPNPNANRGPRNDATKSAPPPVQEKDFPALGPHGSDAVKA